MNTFEIRLVFVYELFANFVCYHSLENCIWNVVIVLWNLVSVLGHCLSQPKYIENRAEINARQLTLQIHHNQTKTLNYEHDSKSVAFVIVNSTSPFIRIIVR